jgi:hypothetical protein
MKAQRQGSFSPLFEPRVEAWLRSLLVPAQLEGPNDSA